MKLITNIGLSITAASVLFLTGCTSGADNTAKVEQQKPQKLVSEESLGLRKVDLYSEDAVRPDETKYGKGYAGSGHKINRAFQDAPPMIPHDTEGMLPIQINNNQCTGCHMPEVASSMGATAIPASHFINFRPDSKAIKGENTSSETRANMSIKKTNTLVGARFNCSQCHAPQSEGQLVENTFQADFTSKDGANKSSWDGSKLTEGLDTLMK